MTLPSQKTVVVDTNLFLHYKRLDHLDWSALQCANVELVVLATVMRELEKVKNLGNSSRLRGRAAEMVTWLSKLMDQGFEVELKKGLRLKFETTESSIDFAEHNLVREVQDDVLIAGLLNLAKATPERPMMATADLGVKAKARQRGFDVFAPLETDKLAEEQDPRDKELSDLRKENQQYKNRQPKLKVAFADGETRLSVQPPTVKPVPAQLDEMLDAIKRQYPFLESATDAAGMPALYQWAHTLHAVPESRRENYNEKLRKFFDDYEKYLHRVEKFRKLARCRVGLPIALFNEGTAPATDIDVVLTFPEGTFVFKELKLLEDPKAPTPPEKPTGVLLGASLINAHVFRDIDLRSHSLPSGLFSRQELEWSLEVTGNTAHFRLDRLKPEFNWSLPVLWLQYPDEGALRSTTVHVEASAAESMGRVVHQLHIIVA